LINPDTIPEYSSFIPILLIIILSFFLINGKQIKVKISEKVKTTNNLSKA
jgi:hypothetical protein